MYKNYAETGMKDIKRVVPKQDGEIPSDDLLLSNPLQDDLLPFITSQAKSSIIL